LQHLCQTTRSLAARFYFRARRADNQLTFAVDESDPISYRALQHGFVNECNAVAFSQLCLSSSSFADRFIDDDPVCCLQLIADYLHAYRRHFDYLQSMHQMRQLAAIERDRLHRIWHLNKYSDQLNVGFRALFDLMQEIDVNYDDEQFIYYLNIPYYIAAKYRVIAILISRIRYELVSSYSMAILSILAVEI
jgi:hypothetical protein